ncbi:Dynamin-related protein 4C [Striga hermonthica]|uniref:Dynamin-related protein 4C n=1 Tax=Striga hermonthica TaxID=68872 RepID=A0A9N7R5B5_STRHE|nr:Dynamin-related protein 4C [Striga hermonthica]
MGLHHHHTAAMVSFYNNHLCPLFDTIDRLCHLEFIQENIQHPTIVVVGDQSSGKSSVLESLTGISLPPGTRVPLIMRFQNHPNPIPELSLEFSGRTMPTDEANVANAIILATEEIAGKGKGISNIPLTLNVKKSGVPDHLTMVDLPGITQVPILDQQISKIIMEYITLDKSIILNVLSASMNLNICESIRMSQQVDPTGQRTLAVVTKADKDPEGLFKKVTSNKVSIGLGYICVRNRVGVETYEEAREKEAQLFKSHHLLSGISRSMVGIAVLAQRLVQIQGKLIIKCLPQIKRNVNNRLSSDMDELSKLPDTITSPAEAWMAFDQILRNTTESLKKILLTGAFDEKDRLTKMLNRYSDEMQVKGESKDKEEFLVDEINVLEAMKRPIGVLWKMKPIGPPYLLPREAFLILLEKKVNGVSFMAFELIDTMWAYIEKVVISVVTKHSCNYPHLLSSMRQATLNLVAKKRKQSEVWVRDMIEMEKTTDYTRNPEYEALWSKLLANQNRFEEILKNDSKPTNMLIDGYGNVDISHLRGRATWVVLEAFDLKMRLTSYWKIVLGRLVDNTAMHLIFNLRNLVNKEMRPEINNEVMGVGWEGLERMLEESPVLAEKRKRLNNSVELLKESSDVVAKMFDDVICGISRLVTDLELVQSAITTGLEVRRLPDPTFSTTFNMS